MAKPAGKQSLNIRIPTLKAMKALAEDEGLNLIDLVDQMLKVYCEKDRQRINALGGVLNGRDQDVAHAIRTLLTLEKSSGESKVIQIGKK